MKKAVNTKAKKPASRVKRDPEGTRRRLLEAGCLLFSRSGYDGVAVDEIVDEAGCNKRMLYHYYGNKDGLYTEVLRSVFRKLEDSELASTEGHSDTGRAVEDLLERYFEFLEENPDFTRLLMWENLNGGRFLEANPDLLTKGPILDRLEALQKGLGSLRKPLGKTDLRYLLILLIGVCSIHFSNQYTLKHTTGLDLTRPSVRRRGLEMAKKVVLHGIL